MTLNLKNREVIQKTKEEDLKKVFNVDANWVPTNYHWKEDQAQKFIDYIVDESGWLLNKFRIIPMSGPTKEIAKILDTGKFLRPWGSYKRRWSNSWVDGISFWNEKIELQTKTIEWKINITYQELEDNIEGKPIEEHIKSICARKIANELVEVAIYWRALTNPNGENGILNVFNGLKYQIKTNGWHVIDAKALSTREMTRATIIKSKKILPTKYRSEVEVFMDSDLKTDLDELYNNPSEFRWNWETIKNSVSWMNINEVPLMSSELPVIDSTKSTTTSWSNAVWQKVINVTNASALSISAWDHITVKYGLADEMTYTVASINTNAITVTENLLYTIASWSTVHKSSLDWADTIITNPKNIIIGIQRDIDIKFDEIVPDWYDVWYTMRQDIVVENPEACVLIENLKSKAL